MTEGNASGTAGRNFPDISPTSHPDAPAVGAISPRPTAQDMEHSNHGDTRPPPGVGNISYGMLYSILQIHHGPSSQPMLMSGLKGTIGAQSSSGATETPGQHSGRLEESGANVRQNTSALFGYCSYALI